MAGYTYATEAALFDRSLAIRRRAWPFGDYVRAHLVGRPVPNELPSETETITRYAPTPEDETATDWEVV